jgi:Rod binding domain-containing protein
LAINPPSDIVLDVARAADPLKLQAAALKLTGAVDDGGDGFANVVDGLEPSAQPGPVAISTPGLIGLQTDFGAKGPQLDKAAALSGPAMKPYRDFEAFVLQSFIQSMLPNDAEGVFGHGTAGEMWKGLLADELGKQLAKSGGIGIAASVLKAHPGGLKAAGLAGSTLGSMAARAVAPSHASIAPAGAAPLMAALSPLDINPVTGAGTISERRP